MLEAFRNRLTESSRCGNLDSANLQDKQSIAQNPVYLAIASQKHCEMSAFGSLTFKKDQNDQNELPRVDYSPTPDCHDLHNLYGDVWERLVPASALLGMQGKRGRFNLNLNGRGWDEYAWLHSCAH